MKTRYLIGIIILVVNLVFVGSVSAQMSLLQTSPADGDVGVALDATLSFTFNQPIDENAEFPFSGKVVFYAPSVWGASTMRCELRFEINEPGTWEIYIYL